MTDPFADLERELLRAHARDTASRRRLRAAPRVLALAATAAAAVVAVAWLGARTDPERAASPQPAQEGWTAYAPGCEQPWQPQTTGDPVPEELAGRLAILRDGPPAAAGDVDRRMPAAQAARLYGSAVALPRWGPYAVSLVAADIIPRREVTGPPDPCAGPQGKTEPGACLMLRSDEGGLAACFTVAELLEGKAYIDVRGHIVGLAPDGARWAVSGEDRAEVERNRFALPGGPGTEVAFVE